MCICLETCSVGCQQKVFRCVPENRSYADPLGEPRLPGQNRHSDFIFDAAEVLMPRAYISDGFIYHQALQTWLLKIHSDRAMTRAVRSTEDDILVHYDTPRFALLSLFAAERTGLWRHLGEGTVSLSLTLIKRPLLNCATSCCHFHPALPTVSMCIDDQGVYVKLALSNWVMVS
jgi:hypothetical protein